MEVTLQAEARSTTGKGPAGRARAAGKVPAVLYGSSQAATPLYLDAKQMFRALHTEAGNNVLINLQLDGDTLLTIPREIQKHPVKGTLVHIDLVKVERNVKIEASVPLHLAGESRGVKEGGQLDQHMHEIKIEALPTDLPPALELDITDVGIGDQLRVGDIQVPAGVEILTDLEEVILAVIEPMTMKTEIETEEAEAAVAAAAAEAEEAASEEAPTQAPAE